jgi:tRNA(fMet)-specific endonuclease VapC
MYFLDTNTCIYYLNGKFPTIALRILSTSASLIKIPSMVKAELLLGAEKSVRKEKTTQAVYSFLEPFEIISFDEIASEYYASIRANLEIQGQTIGPNDLIIASTVLSPKGILITNNMKEFSRVNGLKLENWASETI